MKWVPIYLRRESILHKIIVHISFNKSHQQTTLHSHNLTLLHSHIKEDTVMFTIIFFSISMRKIKGLPSITCEMEGEEKLVDTNEPSHKSTINKYILLENFQLILNLWTDFVDLSFTFLCFPPSFPCRSLLVVPCIWIFDSRLICGWVSFFVLYYSCFNGISGRDNGDRFENTGAFGKAFTFYYILLYRI